MLNKEHVSLLRENEHILLTLHRHWIILIFHFLYFVALFASSAILLNYQTPIIDLFGSGLYWGGISLYWIVFLTFILLDWINDELDIFIITDSRVIGIDQISALARSVSECSLDRVQEVNAHTAGIFQTIFGFGEVHIHTASETSNMVIKYAPDPIESARRINNVIQEYRKSHETRV
ncbi:MAG: PH domain-containing protein [Candidatus Gracilibacteria bacterium]|nr:PH domain-containing protein [Candidatus Gracilibacteria bacterium]